MRVIKFAASRAVLILALVPLVAAACHTPPSTATTTGLAQAYVPGLGEIMALTQMRHIKLWFAGEAENWSLADYELDELEEGFADAARFHPTHKDAPQPLTDLIPEFADPPLRSLRIAVANKDGSAFVAAYDSLTSSCNGCHQVASFSFNVVSRPTMNPYSNQEF